MFGKHVRQLREKKKRGDRSFSVRQVAGRIGVEPAYLSKVELGRVAPPSEEKVIRLARELGEDPDVLLSLAGKVSSDVLAIIRRHPRALAGLVRSLRNVSEMKITAMSRPGKGGMK
jgi:transcriptional regulator with XRE-family HTH domain